MQLKIDGHLPDKVADLLQSNRHDAMTISDQHAVGELDPKVARVCEPEGCAVLTQDLDVSDIQTDRPSDYSGIIILRPRTQSKPEVLGFVKKTPSPP